MPRTARRAALCPIKSSPFTPIPLEDHLGVSSTVESQHHAGHTLVQERLALPTEVLVQLRMRVHVDEAGGNQETAHPEGIPRLQSRSRGVADERNDVSRHCDVREEHVAA